MVWIITIIVIVILLAIAFAYFKSSADKSPTSSYQSDKDINQVGSLNNEQEGVISSNINEEKPPRPPE